MYTITTRDEATIKGQKSAWKVVHKAGDGRILINNGVLGYEVIYVDTVKPAKPAKVQPDKLLDPKWARLYMLNRYPKKAKMTDLKTGDVLEYPSMRKA